MKNVLLPFNASILLLGFIKAESAVMGLLNGCMGIFISTITILFCGEVSRTHIYLSDSIVTWVKVMNCGLIPKLRSCKEIRQFKIIKKKHYLDDGILFFNGWTYSIGKKTPKYNQKKTQGDNYREKKGGRFLILSPHYLCVECNT